MIPIRDIFRSYAVIVDGKHVNGTDKQSNHNYGDAYESLFSDRNSVKLMMEIGVADGSCLLAWRDIFPNALIVGMDIHHSDKAHGDRIEFRRGDQRIQRDCENAAADRQFDLIVEDATHHLDHTLLTLYWMWPFVKPGGLYVVEEWDGVHESRDRIKHVWPNAEIVDTTGPFGGVESLVIFRRPYETYTSILHS